MSVVTPSAGTVMPIPSGLALGRGRPTRSAPVDGFRGFAVLLMALGNFEIGVRAFPAWLKHTPDVGFTIADVVAPMFVVAIAMTVGTSMRRRRVQHGSAAARWHLAKRALVLIGIGAIISAGQSVVHSPGGADMSWGALQCLGVSTLLLLPFIFTPAWSRVVLGLCYLAGYQLLLDQYWLEMVLRSSHNGLAGTLSWAGLLLFASGVADACHDIGDPVRQTRLLLLAGTSAATAALLLSGWAEVSKARASATYMLLSLGLCLLVFAAFHVWLHERPTVAGWLQRVGRNPLIMYLANLVLLAVLVLPSAPWWYEYAPLWLSLVQAAAIAAANVALAYYLDRRRVVLSL